MIKKLIIALLIVSMAIFCFVSCDDDDDDSSSETETTYAVGDTGPAGGIVFYDKGSYSDDWRYLEAAPADLGLIGSTPSVDSSATGYSEGEFVFGYYRTSATGTNWYVNGSTTYDSSNCTGTDIGTGASNTTLLVSKMGSPAYSSNSGTGTTANYAARLCDILEYTNESVTYDDWFLPSKEELNLMYENLHENSLGGFDSNYYYCSSSEGSNAEEAWLQYFSNGSQDDFARLNPVRVRPLRAF